MRDLGSSLIGVYVFWVQVYLAYEFCGVFLILHVFRDRSDLVCVCFGVSLICVVCV